ncbi:unnamed protein product [Closterium sp. Naga37s-1]|nr:unnamed protein product [Closterium sp. Naga37s-1]
MLASARVASAHALSVACRLPTQKRHHAHSHVSLLQGRKNHVARHICHASHPNKTETTTSTTTITAAASIAAAGGGLWALLAALPIPAALAETAADADAVAAAAAALADACSQELGGADLNTVIAVACVVQLIALIGAGVGGWVARVRKAEVERINAQLRQINISLRKQARVESYAPSLSYAPVGQPAAAAAAVAAVSAPPEAVKKEGGTVISEEKQGVLRLLKEGKRYLREGNNAAAFVQFEKGLQQALRMGDCLEEKKAARGCGAAHGGLLGGEEGGPWLCLPQALRMGDCLEEKKAARGCGFHPLWAGASLQRQGKYREAIAYHQRVLDKSCSSGEHAGDTEAHGTHTCSPFLDFPPPSLTLSPFSPSCLPPSPIRSPPLIPPLVPFLLLHFSGASLQRQGKYREAIAYHQRVLDKSCSSGEHAQGTQRPMAQAHALLFLTSHHHLSPSPTLSLSCFFLPRSPSIVPLVSCPPRHSPGASLQRQGKYREAIAYHQRVLDKSCSSGEHAGDTEAYGAIADCYTEIGDLENAAKYYDRYISRMESDDEDH